MNKTKDHILTEREQEVLNLLFQGYSNPEIAKILVVTVYTVKAHLENIYEKFAVNNRVQAVVYAIKNNIL